MAKTVTVTVPKPSGQYGIPQLGAAEQIFYDVTEGTCQVPSEELARFLFVVEGSAVVEQAEEQAAPAPPTATAKAKPGAAK